MLQLYNSLTRTKEVFKPMQPGKIGLYVCGITVYDLCHLGHARSMVCFDMIVRFLRSQDFEVHFVRNITDIDDKIIQRAQERGLSIEMLTSQTIAAMHADMAALKLLPVNKEPRATDHIVEMIQLIEQLVERQHAYIADNGDVCFSVASFPDYGKLSHQSLEGLVAGARVEVAESKRSPLDFVLWKKAKPDEPHWPSPWGEGRPGWHIECSAMAMDELGEQFDIHGGGLDLQFPHHENEIAQSEGATQKPFANYWLHVGMLQVNHEKMSKSTGNFFTIADVLKEHHPEVIRYFLLSAHYRSPLNYSTDNLKNAAKALARLYQSIKAIPLTTQTIDNHWKMQFDLAMNDDFNTPDALAVLFELSREINKTQSPELAKTLIHLGSVLGLLQTDPADFLQTSASVDKTDIEALIVARLEARQQKDWGKADLIRDQLTALGIELEDGPQGTTWRLLQR